MTGANAEVTALLEQVQQWIDADPDHAARIELGALLKAAKDADEEALDELRDRFAGTLQFGTAGLRGRLGAGPNRMNRAVVVAAAAGLTAYLQEQVTPQPTVVIGYDARFGSRQFALDTAAVVTAAGGHALLLPRPLPTPVLAYAVRALSAHAGVMVTASHNPPQDNGYKVYLGDGCQIVPPADVDIAAHIAAVGPADQVPRAEDGWDTLDDAFVQGYVDAVAALVRPDSSRDVSVVHTSLHGVGDDTVRAAFSRAGFPTPTVVPEQAVPDPGFPTVAFPNPEEPGAIDLALALAAELSPDIVIANDPDADRCAAAVLDAGQWRMLHGDELGALLGWHLLQRGVPDGHGFGCSIVSSRLLAAMAAAAGVPHTETLTGFKWIARVPQLAYGYEEAIGYCVAPQVVRDKDGISAALLLAELVAELKMQGRTVLDVLSDLAAAHGVYATDSFSVRVAELSQIGALMARLRQDPPQRFAGIAVERFEDLLAGSDELPPTDGLRFFLADGSRVIIRPSGTEPKVKIYLEVIEPTGRVSVAAARQEAAARLAALTADVGRATAL